MRKFGRVLLGIATFLFFAVGIMTLIFGFVGLSKLPNGLNDLLNNQDQVYVLAMFISGGIAILVGIVGLGGVIRNKAGFLLVVFSLIMLASIIYTVVVNVQSGLFVGTNAWKSILNLVINSLGEVFFILGTLGLFFRKK